MKNFPRIGILGGGQLGKMLCEAGLPWHLPLHILDQSTTFPAGPYAPFFTEGDFTQYDDVFSFGQQMDVMTIEIEKVNVRALMDLEKQGVKVYPQPRAISIIQDKGTQKEFFIQNGIDTAPFENLSHENFTRKVQNGEIQLPIVQKARTGGYDGQGVKIVKELSEIMPVESMVEQMADIRKEISVIVARSQSGEVVSYDPVEMVFDPEANLVDYLFSPAHIPKEIAQMADQLAKSVIVKLDMVGILAVEMFWNHDNTIWVNEVAPRPHNSGHQTIKNTECSQYEQLLRVLCDLPLIPGKSTTPGMMVNILGSPEGEGKPRYLGLNKVLSVPGIHMFLYGKTESRPFRKMGHFTITGKDREDLLSKAQVIKDNFKITIE